MSSNPPAEQCAAAHAEMAQSSEQPPRCTHAGTDKMMKLLEEQASMLERVLKNQETIMQNQAVILQNGKQPFGCGSMLERVLKNQETMMQQQVNMMECIVQMQKNQHDMLAKMLPLGM